MSYGEQRVCDGRDPRIFDSVDPLSLDCLLDGLLCTPIESNPIKFSLLVGEDTFVSGWANKLCETACVPPC